MVALMKDDLLEQRTKLSHQIQGAKQLLSGLEQNQLQIPNAQSDLPGVEIRIVIRNFADQLNADIDMMADTIALIDHLIGHLDGCEPYSQRTIGEKTGSPSTDTNDREMIQYPEFVEGDGGPGSGG